VSDDSESNWREWLTWRRGVIAGITISLLAGGALAARPAYRQVKRWRAHSLDAEGEKFLKQKNWEQAFRKAQSALALSASDVRSQRLMAQVLSHFNHDQALPFWRQVVQSKEATPDDIAELVRTALRQRQWPEARTHLEPALKERPEDARFLGLGSDFCALQGDWVKAVAFARAAVAKSTNAPDYQLMLAQRLAGSPEPDAKAEAKAILQTLARTDNGPAALEALTVLALQFPANPAELEEYVTRLTQHPQHGVPHEVLAFDLKLRQQPENKNLVAQQAIQRLSTFGDEGLIQVSRWLSRNGMNDRVVEVITPARALSRQELFLIRADALAALKQWTLVDEELNHPSVPLDPTIIAIFKARAAKELGRTDLVPLQWSQAQRKAYDNAEALQFLASYAVKVGEIAEAQKAYRRLTEFPQHSRMAYAALVQIAERSSHTRDLRELMAEIMTRIPDEVAARNDWAYLTLLLQENVENAQQIAQKLHQQAPNFLAYRISLALAHLRSNNPQAALALLKDVAVDWPKVSPGWQAVFAATLAANGDTNAAKFIARSIPAKSLKIEERQLISSLL
jgi:predicted Zn-dependent protease